MRGAELEEMRMVNRARLGMSGLNAVGMSDCECKARGVAGLAAGIPGGLLPTVRIQTAFPPVSVEWAPGAEQPTQQSGSGFSMWLTKHVIRPSVAVGPVMVSPYDQEADYSQWANALVVIGIGATTVAGAWALGRVLGGRS